MNSQGTQRPPFQPHLIHNADFLPGQIQRIHSMEKDEDPDDAFDTLPSGHRRRSARKCVRKVKAVPSEVPCRDITVLKKSRKKKNVSFEDDPNYSEVEDEDELSQHQRKVQGYCCSPHLIPELMGKPSDKQRGWVKNIDWHSLQDIIVSRMPKSLTMWLVDRVDTIEVYKWIALAISISSDFCLRWLVHEA